MSSLQRCAISTRDEGKNFRGGVLRVPISLYSTLELAHPSSSPDPIPPQTPKSPARRKHTAPARRIRRHPTPHPKLKHLPPPISDHFRNNAGPNPESGAPRNPEIPSRETHPVKGPPNRYPSPTPPHPRRHQRHQRHQRLQRLQPPPHPPLRRHHTSTKKEKGAKRDVGAAKKRRHARQDPRRGHK